MACDAYFIFSVLWGRRLRLRHELATLEVVESGLGICVPLLRLLQAVSQSPMPPPASHPPLLNSYVLNIQVGCQDNYSETMCEVNGFSNILQLGWLLF